MFIPFILLHISTLFINIHYVTAIDLTSEKKYSIKYNSGALNIDQVVMFKAVTNECKHFVYNISLYA